MGEREESRDREKGERGGYRGKKGGLVIQEDNSGNPLMIPLCP